MSRVGCSRESWLPYIAPDRRAWRQAWYPGRGIVGIGLSRPRQRFSYEPESTLFDLAAAYGFGLAKNHPFIDGNIRAALAIAALFLELNGFSLDAPEPEAVVMIAEFSRVQSIRIRVCAMGQGFSDSN